MTKNQLAVDHLRKTFNDGESVAVNDVSFEVPEGEIAALLGPSGCGKTTTLRCIAGVEVPDSGTIQIGDTVVTSSSGTLAPEKRGVGMVFQSYAIWPHKTVFENVIFSLRHSPNHFDPDEYEDRVDEILEIMQIPELRDKPATDLSGGQQQRTSLARAVVHDPELLLLDEPLSNLDAQLRTEMRNEIQRLQYELGITMLYVTHDQEEAFYLADKIMVMRDGDIIERGDPVKLYNEPSEPFTRSFVGRWNQFDVVADNGRLDTPIGTLTLDDLSLRGSDHRGDRVGLYIRPTDVKVEHDDSAAGSHQFSGVVIAEGVIGEMYEITVELDDDSKLTIQTDDYLQVDRGENLSLSVDPGSIQSYRLS